MHIFMHEVNQILDTISRTSKIRYPHSVKRLFLTCMLFLFPWR